MRYQSLAEKSAKVSEILICWGHTASQLRQPIQAEGFFSSGSWAIRMGAIKPPPVKTCSLYSSSSMGMSSPWGQWVVQYRQAVQGTEVRPVMLSATESRAFISWPDRGFSWAKVFRLSSSWSMADMPESVTIADGMD